MSIFVGELREAGLPDGILSAESVIMSEKMSTPVKLGLWFVNEGVGYGYAAELLGLDPRNLCTAASLPSSPAEKLRPRTARTPGRQSFGALKSSGKRRPTSTDFGNSRRASPTAAMTTFEPSFNPLPE